jgi:hypothetical protein
MAVVERQANAIEAQAGKELDIVFHEEIFKELVEKEFLFLLPQNLEHGSSMLELMAWIPGAGVHQLLYQRC